MFIRVVIFLPVLLFRWLVLSHKDSLFNKIFVFVFNRESEFLGFNNSPVFRAVVLLSLLLIEVIYNLSGGLFGL